MQNEYQAPESTEPMSALEVRALVERFGERQAMAGGQPTVRDVAEALQVDPGTVAQMLQELRQSKNDDDIRVRLDQMERENAELRQRALNPVTAYEPASTGQPMRPQLLAVFMALFVAMATATMVTSERGGTGVAPFLVVCLLMVVGIIVVVTRAIKGK
jgi:hypothetical protein